MATKEIEKAISGSTTAEVKVSIPEPASSSVIL
jgi:hypothetical protein